MEIYKSEKGEMHFKHSDNCISELRKTRERKAVNLNVGIMRVYLGYCDELNVHYSMFKYDHTAEPWEF